MLGASGEVSVVLRGPDVLSPAAFGWTRQAEQAVVTGFGDRELITVAVLNAAFAHVNLAFRCLPMGVGNMKIFGKIMDAASSEQDTLFGLQPNQFYLGLGALLAIGASANYGRIIILRMVGERIVTKLRSQLFKRTFIQNAEFFDANRVGDLY